VDIEHSKFFSAGIGKLIPHSRQPAIVSAIDAHLRNNALRISVPLRDTDGRSFRVARIYVGQSIGYLRLLLEIAEEKIVIWNISRG
jgi:hypothetical protein